MFTKGIRMKLSLTFVFLILLCALSVSAPAADNGNWYTSYFGSEDIAYRGEAKPLHRVKVTLVNKLDFDRTECPVTIRRIDMPLADNYSEWITVVDPDKIPHEREENGAYLLNQLDDIDKDGIWDELFFMVDVKARETKTVYVYIGRNMTDEERHYTHAEIGMYGKHVMPWWESEHIGWKFWYADGADMYGKREAKLVANVMDTFNYGHNTPYSVGSDIMWVRSTFGAGGVCLFEHSALPDSLSRPRFSPFKDSGAFENTRYAYHVVVNGPVRSIIRAHTMNWRTGSGSYEMEQYLTSYKNKSYYTCKTNFTEFFPEAPGLAFGAGIRRLENESLYYQDGNIVITGTNDLRSYITPNEGDPDLKEGVKEFLGIALTVKDGYSPKFHHTMKFGENLTFRLPATDDLSFEFMAFGGWSEGLVNSTAEEFKDYVVIQAKEYNNPLVIGKLTVEERPEEEE